MRRLAFILTMFCFIEHHPLQAQNPVVVQGFVVDALTNEALPYANVLVVADSNGTVSNRFGFFSIRSSIQGGLAVRFSYVGYKPLDTLLNQGATDKPLHINLQPYAVELSEIEVVGSSPALAPWYPATQVLVQNQLAIIPSPGERDLLRSLQKLPGITSSSELSSGLNIRGGTPDQNLILLDGITVYNPSHVFGFFSMFHHDAIKAVRVMKGGFPAEYGTRSGSVIDILSIDGNRNEMKGKASIGLVNAGLMINGPVGTGTWMLAARRSYFEAMKIFLSNFGFPDYFFYDIHAKIMQDMDESNRLSTLFLVNRDDLLHESRVNTGSLDEALYSRWSNALIGLEWTSILTSSAFLRAQVALSKYSGNLTATPNLLLQRALGTGNSLFHYDNSLSDITGRVEVEHNLSDKMVLTMGVYQTSYLIKYSTDARFDSRRIAIDRSYSITGFFAQSEMKFGDLVIIPGGRLTKEQGKPGFLVEPRLIGSYRFSNRLQIKAGAGRYFQWLNGGQPASFLTFSGIDFWFPIGNGIPPSRSDQVSLDFVWNITQDLSATIGGYYSRQTGIAELRQDFENSSTLGEMFALGAGRNEGYELLLEGSAGQFRGMLSYTLSWATRRFPEIEQGRRFYARHDKRHMINLVTTTRLSETWDFSIAWNYSTGQAYTGILGYYELDQFTPDIGAWNDLHFFLSEKNAFRLPNYHRMDISATKTFNYENWKLQLRIDVFNAYSRLNALGANTGFSSDPYYRLLPIIPTVTLEAEF